MNFKLLLILGILYNTAFFQAPIAYQHYSMEMYGYPQSIHNLIIDTTNPNIKINNRFSYDKIYGFESVSKISKRYKSLAAVNGSFYTELGLHAGGMIKNHKLITLPVNTTPMVKIKDNGKFMIENMKISSIVSSDKYSYEISGVNRFPYNNELIMYDSIYGSNTRVFKSSKNYVIINNKIDQIIVSDTPINIPNNGYILCDVGANNNLLFQIGDTVEINNKYIDKDSIANAFQTGGWLVNNGVNVAKDYEPFIGNTKNLEPRTLLGKQKDGKMLLSVIDGRYKDKSLGLSGFLAAEIMKFFDCTEAVYLDGGASSTMVIGQEVVNHPSNGGNERKVAHALTIDKKNMIK